MMNRSETDHSTLASKYDRRDKANLYEFDGSPRIQSLGLKPFLAKHQEPLVLTVKPNCMSATMLDMQVTDNATGANVFKVQGRFMSFSRKLHVSHISEDGKAMQQLYTMKQKTLCCPYTFDAVDKEHKEADGKQMPVFTAKARSSLGSGMFDLDASFANVCGQDGRKSTVLHVKSGIVSSHTNI